MGWMEVRSNQKWLAIGMFICSVLCIIAVVISSETDQIIPIFKANVLARNTEMEKIEDRILKIESAQEVAIKDMNKRIPNVMSSCLVGGKTR